MTRAVWLRRVKFNAGVKLDTLRGIADWYGVSLGELVRYLAQGMGKGKS
jgi:hypothetical protein